MRNVRKGSMKYLLSTNTKACRCEVGHTLRLRYNSTLPRRDAREAEGGALLRRYAGLNLHRGFESLSLRHSTPNVLRTSGVLVWSLLMNRSLPRGLFNAC